MINYLGKLLSEKAVIQCKSNCHSGICNPNFLVGTDRNLMLNESVDIEDEL